MSLHNLGSKDQSEFTLAPSTAPQSLPVKKQYAAPTITPVDPEIARQQLAVKASRGDANAAEMLALSRAPR